MRVRMVFDFDDMDRSALEHSRGVKGHTALRNWMEMTVRATMDDIRLDYVRDLERRQGDDDA